MATTRTLTCSGCSAILILPLQFDYRGYYWHVTATGRTTCPPCLAANGRVVGAPRARTRAVRTGHTYSMTGNGTTGHTPDTGLVTVNLLLPEFEEYTGSNHTGVHGGEVGGVGEETKIEIFANSGDLSRRRDKVEPPERLREFDAILRRHMIAAPTRNARRRYQPTEKYYARIMERYSRTPGLDFAEEAEAMLSWMADHPSKTTDVCRFSENWLTIAQERAIKRARANGNGRYNGKPQTVATRYQMGSGAGSLPDDVRESSRAFDQRGGAHYDEG